jgi:LysM repeat protein
MKNLRQVFLGFIIALSSICLLLGGLSLSLAEGNTPATLTPTLAPTLTPTHTLMPTASPTWPSPTPRVVSPTSTSSPSSTRTPTLPPPPTNCPPPIGWVPYVVQPDDTLDKIAVYFRVNSSKLQQANCLLTTGLLPGVLVYVPPVPTPTSLPCGAPYNWIVYIIQPGDTLYHLGQVYGISVTELQRANCLGNSTLLHTGQRLYVPFLATRTPSPLPLIPATPTGALTNTPDISSLPSITPSDTPIPAASDTPVEIPTETPTISTT